VHKYKLVIFLETACVNCQIQVKKLRELERRQPGELLNAFQAVSNGIAVQVQGRRTLLYIAIGIKKRLPGSCIQKMTGVGLRGVQGAQQLVLLPAWVKAPP
jgi:hypothetical protein